MVLMVTRIPSYHTAESFAAWNLFQRDLTRLSKNSKHIIVEGAGHRAPSSC